jgi:membrane-bound metal-dependent hydrolase YbcI (DUF457 family)
VTTYEHAMLGACGVLATGLFRKRRYGWPLVAIGAVAAVLPDWDGLSLALGPAMFDRLHRAAGHNLLVCVLVGAVAAAFDYRYSLVCRAARLARSRLGRFLNDPRAPSPIRRRFRARELGVWIAVGVAASLSHLAADLVFSGHARLADWGLTLFWPFSDREYVFPMVRWGDALPTVIFVVGMLAMLRWPARIERIARLTLVAEIGYIVLRGILLRT